MTDIEAHRHRYRSPIAAIVGLADSILMRSNLDEDLARQLQAIRALAQEALEADDARRARRARGDRSPPPT
jgi:signal transduction histidine kinase